MPNSDEGVPSAPKHQLLPLIHPEGSWCCRCGITVSFSKSRKQAERAFAEHCSAIQPPENLTAGVPSAEQLAQRFHEAYERLAPQFDYKTRRASAVPWAEVPENNKKLMTAVCAEILSTQIAAPGRWTDLRKELVDSRTAWFEQFGVPISEEFARFVRAMAVVTDWGDSAALRETAARQSAKEWIEGIKSHAANEDDHSTIVYVCDLALAAIKAKRETTQDIRSTDLKDSLVETHTGICEHKPTDTQESSAAIWETAAREQERERLVSDIAWSPYLTDSSSSGRCVVCKRHFERRELLLTEFHNMGCRVAAAIRAALKEGQ